MTEEKSTYETKDQKTAIIKDITDKAQYDFKSKIAATMRYTGGKEIDLTDRTPAVKKAFFDYYRDEVAAVLDSASADEIETALEEAFQQLVEECTIDFFDFKKKQKDVVQLIYIIVIVILVLALIFYKLGWNIKM
ncbi:MAG: hypothetical protein VB012_01770 [Erysipelotrichaceae bacterium]|nr:hypothetical protein [Erysipelotrichaceae bacterium]